jgi:hypothetical protein
LAWQSYSSRDAGLLALAVALYELGPTFQPLSLLKFFLTSPHLLAKLGQPI